jgi:regulator of sigma E protease
MLELASTAMGAIGFDVGAWVANSIAFLKVLIGFSIIIFVHELGHFLVAKACKVRVDRFAVGFGYRLFGYRRGEGLTFGNRPELSSDELGRRGWGETDYCFKAFPVGGYVKMLGQDDIVIDEKTGDVRMSTDPRAFTNRPVGQRMLVASAGVIFNVLFAAVLMVLVFFVGLEQTAPVVGGVQPGTQAQAAAG